MKANDNAEDIRRSLIDFVNGGTGKVGAWVEQTTDTRTGKPAYVLHCRKDHSGHALQISVQDFGTITALLEIMGENASSVEIIKREI